MNFKYNKHVLPALSFAIAGFSAIVEIGCAARPSPAKTEKINMAEAEAAQPLGVVISRLDDLLRQWTERMSRPDTVQTLADRRGLAQDLERRVNLRFDELRQELETSATTRNREIIAAALGFSRKPEALNPLVNCVIDDAVPSVKEKALLGLGRLADKNTPIDVVAARLGSEFTDGEQWNASFALIRLATAGVKIDAALPGLRDGLKSRNPAIRLHCATALGLAHDTKATPLLIAALKDDRPLPAAAAANALGAIGEPSSAPALVDALGSQDHAVRQESRRALTKMNGGEDLGAESGMWRRWLQKFEAANRERPASLPAAALPAATLVK